MYTMSQVIVGFSNFLWGISLLILLIGGGVFFLIYSKFIPFRYFGHAVAILRGKYDNKSEPGDISHYQALSTALAATVGMGNVSGVAIAIVSGGPGAIFWMWISALVGVATKYFTNTLAVMYRGKDSSGELQGGPMYYIEHGLGKRWKPLAIFFSLMGAIAVVPIFQANQLTQIVRDVLLVPNGIQTGLLSDLTSGIVIALIMGLVIFGGIKRIGKVTGQIVPFMVVVYFITVLYILVQFRMEIPSALKLIFEDAFSGNAVLGGALGALIITGIKRAAFSNEAGIGTAPLAHGAVKTSEPVREGLVAMLGPVIDTIIVCTLTALAIIVTGHWRAGAANGITITAHAFNSAIPEYGAYILMVCVTFFALSTLFAYPYYGSKCTSYLFGTKSTKWYWSFSLLATALSAIISMDVVVGIIDSAYALMAFPNMLAALLLAPKVLDETKRYFKRYGKV